MNSGEAGSRAESRNAGFCFPKPAPHRGEKIQGIGSVSCSETRREKDFCLSDVSAASLEWMRVEEFVGLQEAPMRLSCGQCTEKAMLVRFIQADVGLDLRCQEQPRRSKEAQV